MERLAMKKVLVVDDNDNCRILAQKNVERIGIVPQNIMVVNDGIAAVTEARKEAFDVIIMDVKMPNMDGITAAQEIKSHYGKDTPKIIVYTATGFVKEQAGSEIFDGVIQKPFKSEDFTKTLLEALNIPSTQA